MKKFDVVIGNPPFQDSEKNNTATSLWIPFLRKAIHLSKSKVLFITPVNWLNLSMKKYDFLQDVWVEVAKIFDDKDNPFKGVGIRTGYTVINVNSNYGETTFKTKQGDIVINLHESGSLPGTIDQDTLSIWYKTMYKDKKLGLNRKNQVHTQRKSMWSERETSEYCYKTYNGTNVIWSNEKKPNYESIKVIVPEAKTHKKVFVDSECNTTQTVFYVEAATWEEAKSIKNLIQSKLFSFLIMKSKWGPANNQTTLENLPAVDNLNVNWTDSDLYSYFNLTKQEINYIEQTIK